jgi:hypothetical protein
MLRLPVGCCALLLVPACTTPLPPIDAPAEGGDAAAPGDVPGDTASELDVPGPGVDAPLGQLGERCFTSGGGCAEGLFCLFPIDALCGADGAAGVCTAPDEACPDTVAPVCGCDARTYDNACLATMAGTSIAENEACVSTCSGEVDCAETAPRCVTGHVPSIVGGCWGPCVPLSACACASDRDCPTGTCDVATRRCG